MLETGYQSITPQKIYKQFICSSCGQYLGEYISTPTQIVDPCKDWVYCPYCATPLE